MLRKVLQTVPHEHPHVVAALLTDDNDFKINTTNEEITARFKYSSLTFHIIQAMDLDVSDKKSFNQTERAKKSARLTHDILCQEDMPIPVQQKLMAALLVEQATELAPLIEKEAAKEFSKPNNGRNSALATLRSRAQEKYWLDMSAAERARAREDAMRPERGAALTLALSIVKANRHKKWDNGRLDCDLFRNYLADQRAAKEVWTLLEDDVLIVLDRNQKIVFANVENLATLLFGKEALDLLDRAIDLWSFFVPLPRPEAARRLVDGYIRRIHPELDPSKATVEELQNAKMAMAHYGCWARKGDPTVGTSSRRSTPASRGPIGTTLVCPWFRSFRRPCSGPFRR